MSNRSKTLIINIDNMIPFTMYVFSSKKINFIINPI